jgi:hypothetical protein
MKSSRSLVEFDLDDSGFFLLTLHPRYLSCAPTNSARRRKFFFEAQLETAAVAGCLTNYLVLI